MNKAQCLPIIGKRSKNGLTLTATNGSASMSCWKSKHRRPSLSLKSVRKQSSNLSSRFRGSSALVGRDKNSNVANRFTDENLLHRTQLIWWQYVTVSWGPFRKWLSEYRNQKDLCHPLSDLCWNKHSTQAAYHVSCLGALRVHATVWYSLTSGGQRAGVDGSCMQVKTRSTSLSLSPHASHMIMYCYYNLSGLQSSFLLPTRNSSAMFNLDQFGDYTSKKQISRSKFPNCSVGFRTVSQSLGGFAIQHRFVELYPFSGRQGVLDRTRVVVLCG